MRSTWTDSGGTAHLVTGDRTLCGVLVVPTGTAAVIGCAPCVHESIRDYCLRIRHYKEEQPRHA